MVFSLSFLYPHPTDINNLCGWGDGIGPKHSQHSNNPTVIFFVLLLAEKNICFETDGLMYRDSPANDEDTKKLSDCKSFTAQLPNIFTFYSN